MAPPARTALPLPFTALQTTQIGRLGRDAGARRHSRLPLSAVQRRREAAEMIAEVEAEAAAMRCASGTQVLGMAAVQAQDPFDRPERLNKTRRPLVHAASRVERESYLMIREDWPRRPPGAIQ